MLCVSAFVLCTKGLAKLTPGEVLPTFYEQLILAQIPKARKRLSVKQLFALLGAAGVKASSKHIGEIDPWRGFFFLAKKAICIFKLSLRTFHTYASIGVYD